MFKAVYFHKTVRSAEVMMLESIRLADEYCGFTDLNLDSYVNLTDEFVISKILDLPNNKEQTRAKNLAMDYQNRRLLKCVYEKIMIKKSQKMEQIRDRLAKKARLDREEIFVDTSGTSSLPLTPAKEKTKSITLITAAKPLEIPFSKIPVVSSMAESVNILRIYTAQNNRNKVEMAAKSILG